jgi:hypothetical protein
MLQTYNLIRTRYILGYAYIGLSLYNRIRSSREPNIGLLKTQEILIRRSV